jgi:hypothetical protein
VEDRRLECSFAREEPTVRVILDEAAVCVRDYKRTPDEGMNWTTHYFDRRSNRDSVSRAFASKEDALRHACDLMRQNCVVRFVKGPNDETIDAVEITAWCKRRPTRKEPAPSK